MQEKRFDELVAGSFFCAVYPSEETVNRLLQKTLDGGALEIKGKRKHTKTVVNSGLFVCDLGPDITEAARRAVALFHEAPIAKGT